MKSLRLALRQPTSLYKGGNGEEFGPLCLFNIQKKGTGENPDTFPGAEGETRTLAPVTRPTPLAGAPLQPLEYISTKRLLQ